MDVTVRIPDEVAERLSARGEDVSRLAVEALALEGYRDHILTILQVSQMLGLTRIETEDFLGQHQVPLSHIGEAELDQEAAILAKAMRNSRH